MIGEWISSLLDKTAAWFGWVEARDDRIDFNLAKRYVAAFERRERDEAERIAAGMRIPKGRNELEPALRHCLELIYRRVPSNTSDASIGGSYRTMSRHEFAGSPREALADGHYKRLTVNHRPRE